LADIAFTLLAGRRHLHHRLALVASDRADLAARLRLWLDGSPDCGVETAELDEKDRRADPARQAEGEALIAAIRAAADPMALLPALARHYLAGDELEYGAACPAGARRVPLPTYPFERKRYWVKTAEQPKPALVANCRIAARRCLAQAGSDAATRIFIRHAAEDPAGTADCRPDCRRTGGGIGCAGWRAAPPAGCGRGCAGWNSPEAGAMRSRRGWPANWRRPPATTRCVRCW
jgi:acyl transferase domain-containing protein